MKRSTFVAISVVLGLTLVLGLVKLLLPSSAMDTVKTVLTGKEWLNTEFGKDRVELKGKNTLVLLWNMSDINSRKTIKKVNEWKALYGGMLQVAGVHCPEFEFEREKKSVVRIVEELKINWPVVLDNNKVLKKMFRNEELPALYIINKNGKTVYAHKSDGDYEMSEAAIQSAIKELYPKAELPLLKKPEITGICFIISPDLYVGTQKGSIANKGGFVSEKTHDYKGSTELLSDTIALKGKFKAFKEYIESDGIGGEVLLNFAATEVNIVADAVSTGEATLEVLLDGKAIKKDIRGKNLEENNRVKLKYPGMYQIIKNNKKAEKGVLSIKVLKGNFRLYAFRFYGCVE